MSDQSTRFESTLRLNSLFSLVGAITFAGWSRGMWQLDVALSLTILLYLLLWGYAGFPMADEITTTLKHIETDLRAMTTDAETDGGVLDGEVRTYGAGSFSGMLVGVALGYPFGTAGVLIGGVVGTFVGDQLEYNHRKRRMEKLLGE